MPALQPLDVRPGGHFVRFFDDDAYLMVEIAEFIDAALRAGGTGILIATPAHAAAVTRRLDGSGAPGQLVTLDARATLDRLLVDGWPDEDRFVDIVGSVVVAAADGGRDVHAFGEMVSLLCADGRHDAALRLEQLWNELAQAHRFALFCAYENRFFSGAEHSAAFRHVCELHSDVRPSEQLAQADDAPQAHRLLAQWQQKALALETEVARRARASAERERLLAELEQALRAKDEFLAMLGHELRNPLSPIVTALQLMRMRGDTGTAREQGIIQRQVEHLVRLVDDLLDVSRITRGKIELKQERVALADVLDKAVEMARPLLEQRGHRLAEHVEPGLQWYGDAVRLAQAAANLLTNAARYTNNGGVVELCARRDGEALVISVTDNGIGIDQRLLPRIFELFYQGGHRGLDRAEGGLGIGLALVKSLVELHGGTVAAASEGPGRGSTFTLRLPLRGPAADAAPTEPATLLLPAPVRRQRVLIVDDNVDGAELVGRMLQAGGHEVVVVNDPVAALQALERFEPDVAVLDIGLPVMDGCELLLRMRERLGESASCCRFVALSGYGRQRDRQRTEAAGFEHHLVKPIAAERLVELVNAGRVSAAAPGI